MQAGNTTNVKTFWTTTIPSNAAYAKATVPTSISHQVKLEYGHRATDWTPAPEDINAEVSDLGDKTNELIEWQGGAQTDFQKLQELIYFLAVGERGEATDFSQFADGFSFSFVKTYKDLNETNANLQTATDSIETLKAFTTCAGRMQRSCVFLDTSRRQT